jgi:hypothetical protein
MIPGGEKMQAEYPSGHGTHKIKSEILDEVVLRAFDEIAKIKDPIPFPYCVFNGGRDCWVDVGTKGVAVEALQAYFNVSGGECIHIGDQFLGTGNDISTRAVCATIWIETPKETFKILDHVLRFSLGKDKLERAAAAARADDLARCATPHSHSDDSSSSSSSRSPAASAASSAEGPGTPRSLTGSQSVSISAGFSALTGLRIAGDGEGAFLEQALGEGQSHSYAGAEAGTGGHAKVMNVYTGEMESPKAAAAGAKHA